MRLVLKEEVLGRADLEHDDIFRKKIHKPNIKPGDQVHLLRPRLTRNTHKKSEGHTFTSKKRPRSFGSSSFLRIVDVIVTGKIKV